MIERFPQYKMVYNLDYKERYIVEMSNYATSGSVSNAVRTFTRTGKYENFLNKDVSQFEINELINLFEQCGWIDKFSFTSNQSILSEYTKWVYKDNANHSIDRIFLSDLSGTIKLKKSFFKDFDSLKEFLTYIYSKGELESSTLYLAYKIYLFLDWYGFERDEIFGLSPKNVDCVNRIISTDAWRAENVNQYVIEECKRYFEVVNSDREEKKVSMVASIAKMRMNINSIIDSLEITDPYYGMEIKHVDVKRSGIFYRLFELEKKGIDIKQNNFAPVEQQGRVSLNAAMTYYGTYQKWKQFFYPGASVPLEEKARIRKKTRPSVEKSADTNTKKTSQGDLSKKEELIKLIYELYIENKSLYKVSKILFSRGIKTPQGKDKWSRQTLAVIIRNEKYTRLVGDDVFNKAQYILENTASWTKNRKH